MDMNFTPPQPPAFAQPVPATTDIVSFFNPNPWPVHVSNNLLGITLTLTQKGDQIRSVDTQELVNDPRLMCFVGQGQLSCSKGVDQRPVVTYRKLQGAHVPSASNFPHGFAASVTAQPRGTTTIAAAVPPPAPPSNSTSVRAFSNRDDAVRAGLIDGKIVELQEGVPDSDSTPPQNAPELRVPAYKQPSPVDMARFAAQQPENAEQQKLVEGLLQPTPTEDVRQIIQSAVSPVAPVTPPAPSPVAPPSVATSTPPDAQPVVLRNAEPQLEPEPQPEAKVAFVDPKSGKKFQYRSLLERYCKSNYTAEEVIEILKPYPATTRGRRG